MRIFAVAAPGLETVVEAEVRALGGVSDVVRVVGGVEWDGDLASLMRASLWLRSATRVLVRVGEVRAKDFAALRRGVARLEWDALVRGRDGVVADVSATAKKCRLYHTGGIAERVIGGIADRGVRLAEGERGRAIDVIVRGENDVFTISVDSSGELLHRRGWRVEQGEAPLRETLAAGMLALAGWDGGTEPLADPTCGSGTIPIEAAMIATHRAPGIDRSFSFASWRDFDEKKWKAIVDEARRSQRDRAPAIVGSDRDAKVIEIARANAERAGVADRIAFEQATITTAKLPAERGLIICNPPYGKRIGDARSLRALYATIGRRARDAGWRLAVLTSDPSLAQSIGGKPIAVHRLTNGGVKVGLYVYAP